jgi:hypothetical protein
MPDWLYKFAGLKNDADHEQLLEALKPLGLTLYVHCSDNCPMHILALDGTEQTAWRGQPRPLTLPEITLEDMKVWEPLKKHLKKKKPGWLLYSWWC